MALAAGLLSAASPTEEKSSHLLCCSPPPLFVNTQTSTRTVGVRDPGDVSPPVDSTLREVSSRVCGDKTRLFSQKREQDLSSALSGGFTSLELTRTSDQRRRSTEAPSSSRSSSWWIMGCERRSAQLSQSRQFQKRLHENSEHLCSRGSCMSSEPVETAASPPCGL